MMIRALSLLTGFLNFLHSKAATSATAINIGPSTIQPGTATSVTLAGSANGALYDWSTAGAADCAGITPAHALTATNQVVSVTRSAGTYQLCYRASGETDSVVQTNGVLTVATIATAITISPSSISASTATTLVFIGSRSGDLYSWSAANAADCAGVTPTSAITATNEAVLVIQVTTGTYRLCYRASGTSDSVAQTSGVLTVVTATSATSILISPTSIVAGTATSVTFTGSANGDLYSWSAAGAGNCASVTPATALTATNQAVSVTQPAGTYQLCYRASGGRSDSVAQTNGVLMVTTSPTAITISPSSISASFATSTTFTGSANGDLYDWSAANAVDCAGVTPATPLTAANQAVSVTQAIAGTYQLCYRSSGGSGSVVQTNGVLTVVAATPANAISITPSSISAAAATNVVFAGSANGDLYSWSAEGAADCTGVTPATALTSANQVVSVTVASPGTYRLCVRKSGGSDAVAQAGGILMVTTSPTAITISPSSISMNTASTLTFTGSVNNDLYAWSAAGASDCTGVIPGIKLTVTNQAVSITQVAVGTYQLCYRSVGASDSVVQTNGVLTVVAASSASAITISPTSIVAGTATPVTFTGSANGDMYSWSAAGVADCTSVTPANTLTSSNQMVSTTHAIPGVYRLCFHAAGGSDSVSQTGGVLSVTTSATAISISPSSLTVGTATDVTFTGSANGDLYGWSAANAADCTGVTPATTITAANQVVSVTQSSTGTYNLCYGNSAVGDSVVQTNGALTVIAATSPGLISISPTSLITATATSVTLTGSVAGAFYSWTAAGAADCTGVTPATSLSSTNEVVSVTLNQAGTHRLCYRVPGGSDSVAQTGGILAVTTSSTVISISPSSITVNTATSVTLAGSSNNAFFSWSVAGATDCTGVTPATQLTGLNQVVSVTQATTGMYRLCFRSPGGSDSVAQMNGVLTVISATTANSITAVSPTHISTATATSVTLSGGTTGGSYGWTAVDSADCTSVMPATALTSTNQVISVNLGDAGTYRLCYRFPGGSDSVLQTGIVLTATGTSASTITLAPASVTVNVGTVVTLAGSAIGDKYAWSSVGAADCSGVTPATVVTTPNDVALMTQAVIGTYRLCYRSSGETDSVPQTSVLNVVAASVPYPSSVSGDPITWFGQRRVEFELPFGKLTTLMRMPDLEVFAAPFQGLQEEQWMGRVVVKSTATGETLLQVDAKQDLRHFDRSTLQHRGRHEFETMTPLFPLSTYYPFENQFLIPETWTWGTYGKPGCAFKQFEPCREAVTIVGKFAKMMIVSSSAKEWYGSVEEAYQHVHLDFDVFEMTNETQLIEGILPQMWGLQPMTAETLKLVKNVSYPYEAQTCSQCSKSTGRTVAVQRFAA
eukprot:TRINITY_DN12441_c0_g1_i1.p1 TRINITY_DN12441_c0_g1~~TRINITY_DN12441_c0_g1_i1.p1  ORF type:complete len:1364 (-),score=174.62 TRINITY_DN12441_c0_g1_i1:105-4196(-)